MYKFRAIQSNLSSIDYFNIPNEINKENRLIFHMANDIMCAKSFGKEPVFINRFSEICDRFGNEIYENDIIMDTFGEYMVIRFKTGCFYAECIDNLISKPLNDVDVHTVIGNIYFNKKFIDERNEI